MDEIIERPTLGDRVSQSEVIDFINHLSFIVSAGGISTNVRDITLCAVNDELEQFQPQSDEMMRLKTRLRDAVCRYWGNLGRIRVCFTDPTVSCRTIITEDGTTLTFHSEPVYGIVWTLIPLAPSAKGLCNMVARMNYRCAKNMIMAGVSPASRIGSGSVLEHFQPSYQTLSAETIAVIQWILHHPDFEWNACDRGILLTCYIIRLPFPFVQCLPWDRIDPHAVDADGNTVLHHHIANHAGSTEDAVRTTELIFAHGSETLLLAVNNRGLRPSHAPFAPRILSHLDKLHPWRSYDVAAAEHRVLKLVKGAIVRHINVNALVAVICAYYTSL